MMCAPFHAQHEYMVIEPVKYYPQNKSFLTREHRLLSFKDWPIQMNPSKEQLADSGFFYLQTCDRVKCFNCGLVLRNWKHSDSATGEHRKHSPDCLFAFLHK
jgi:E3 ubiquitin-protein ligase XIAP